MADPPGVFPYPLVGAFTSQTSNRYPCAFTASAHSFTGSRPAKLFTKRTVARLSKQESAGLGARLTGSTDAER